MYHLIHLIIYLVIDLVVRQLMGRGDEGHARWKQISDDDVRNIGQGRSRGNEPNITCTAM